MKAAEDTPMAVVTQNVNSKAMLPYASRRDKQTFRDGVLKVRSL